VNVNKVNVNFRRGQYKNKWLDPSHLEEIENLQNELLFDKKLTFFEKSIILKSKNRIKPACKFCSKEYKAVNKFLLNHDISCPLNPLVAKSLTLHSFKAKVLAVKGSCPKCGLHSNKLRQHASTCFEGINDFSEFLPSNNLPKEQKIFDCFHNNDTALLSELPFFNFEGTLTENELSVVGDFRSHIDRINEFKSKHNNKKKLIVLHLNFNSVSNKVFELDEVLEKCNPDCFLINESKLDSQKPNSWYINKKYNCLRLDREDEGGGGNLAFIRKGIVIKKVGLTNLANFITAYKSPSKDNNEFLEKLENFLLLLNPYEPLFIFGDLNMDLKSSKGNDLAKFMSRNELKNFVDVYTRIFRKYYKETKDYKTSKTLIDVAIHNQKKIIETAAIGCPFSDHHFVIAALDFHSPKLATFSNFGRSLSEKNLFLIGDHLKNSSHEFEIDRNNKDIDRIWQEYKLKITGILDLVSPVSLYKERP
jgi:hypothetical protein